MLSERKLDKIIRLKIDFSVMLRVINCHKNPKGLVTMPWLSTRTDLPESCEVLSVESRGDCIIVTLWHESFPSASNPDVLQLGMGRTEVTVEGDKPSRDELIDGFSKLKDRR